MSGPLVVDKEARAEPIRRRWQLSLATMLLVVTLCVVLAAIWQTAKMRAELQTSVASMRSLTREVIVEDPTKIAIVKRRPTLSDELIFDAYIPPPQGSITTHRLCLVIAGITDDRNGAEYFPIPDQMYEFTVPALATDASANLHSIELQETGHVQVLVDGRVVMTVDYPPDWYPNKGWTSRGTISESQSFNADQRVELLRRRNNYSTVGTSSRSTPPAQPANGILLWIEPVPR